MKRIFHKVSLMLTLALIFLLAAPMTALADGGGADAMTQTKDGYQVTLVFEEPVTRGENAVHVQVLDPQGMPVSNAQVEVSLVEVDEHVEDDEADHTETEPYAGHTSQQDAMGAMGERNSAPTPTPMSGMEGLSAGPAEHSETLPEDAHTEMGMGAFKEGHELGEYEGGITITGSGEQIIRIHLTVDGRLIEFDFPVNIPGAPPGKTILLSYAALNAVILGVAAFIKFKPVSA